jgi:putative membrane protein
LFSSKILYFNQIAVMWWSGHTLCCINTLTARIVLSESSLTNSVIGSNVLVPIEGDIGDVSGKILQIRQGTCNKVGEMAKLSTKKLAALAFGFALVAALIVWQGGHELFKELQTGGWPLLWVSVFVVPDQISAALTWYVLFPSNRRPSFPKVFWAAWIGAALNVLLPVAGVGGELLKARLVHLWGANGLDAVSTTIVDKTVQAVTIFFWGLIGVFCFAWVVPDHAAFWGALVAAITLGFGIGLFILVQVKGGISRVGRLAGNSRLLSKWDNLIGTADNLDAAVRAIYDRPATFAASCLIRLLGRLTLVGEIYLAAMLMGDPISFAQALILKSIVSVARGASFAIPAGIGVQEGAYIAVGALIGIPPEFALALSLATRIREIVPNLPVFAAWQVIEGRQLARRMNDRK